MTQADVVVQHGFYRYSDILWEYHKITQKSDPAGAYAWKAFISHEALVDPGHPLHVDQGKGIELFVGMLPNGQMRLLFSSRQIEYACYWLYEMKLAKSPLPLPSSDYLLTKNVLRNLTTVHYKCADDLKKATRMIDRINRRLKGTVSALTSFRQLFENVRQLYNSKKAIWLAIDIEAWEMEHDLVTECGWEYVRWEDGKEDTDRGHYIIEENMIFTNGKYVPNARDKYKFGKSKVLNKAAFKRTIRDMIANFQQRGPLILVFHDSSQDIKYLKGKYFDVPLGNILPFLPSDVPEHGTFSVDTTELFGALEGDVGEKRSLARMCRLLSIEAQYLHNAGNDAHYTLMALKSMASGNQVDAQRAERWPSQNVTATEPNLKIFYPPDQHSDFSVTDDED